MTVAALLFAKTFPIVITDHLISSKILPEAPVNTALTDTELRESDSGEVPVGMAAKVWHVDNKMYMIYAGSVAHAQLIRDKVRAKTTYAPYSEEIHKDITDWADASHLKASFILIFLGTDGYIHYMGHGARIHSTPHFGDVLIIGTGEKPLLESILKAAESIQAKPPIADEIQMAMSSAVAVQANATVGYMNFRSEFASKATGGLFALSYLPKCYGWSEKTPPPSHAQNRVCELFTEYRVLAPTPN